MNFGGNEIDLRKTKKKEILYVRRHSAFVFQNYGLFAHKTAIQNVMEGGVVVEEGKPDEIFYRPKEERTRQFLSRIMPANSYVI